MEIKHYNIRVYGRVQGINFRWSACKKANSLGLFGFVRNEPDGFVYIEAEGGKEMLNQFTNWCKKGPWFSKVERVTVEEGGVKGYNAFEIIY